MRHAKTWAPSSSLRAILLFDRPGARSQGKAAIMDSEIEYELPGLIRVHKSGFVERLQGTETSPPSPSGDPATGVASKDVVLGDPASNVSVRLYLPSNAAAEPGKKLPVVVFYYGGAFVVSTAATVIYHRYAASLAAAVPAVVVSVNYRLAPETPLPAAYDDVFAGLKAVVAACRPDGAEPWLATYGDASRIVLAGDSAGANLAHHTAVRLRKEPIEGYGDEVRGVALLYSYFWGKEPLGGEPADAAVRGRFERSWEVACDGKFGPDHPYINPFSAPQEEWRQLGCRRVLVTTGELCWFVERSRAYVEAIKACGWDGELDFYETKGKGHVYFLFNPDCEEAIKDLAVVADFVRRC
ncbi:probable carboxylesterase 2 [Lolium rigidum]|uniref:probable carboxylesterase 2 n=1 Tax=Lolium rigidum TaxID=89674 RepID=UPI001F5CFD5F|nr:probable carboxylesterase 2 [Lolium rigidum]